MKKAVSGAVLALALMAAPAMAQASLAGAMVTSSYTSDDPTAVLWGWVPTFSDYSATNVAVVSDSDIEFVSSDGAFMLDFSSNGSLTVTNIFDYSTSFPTVSTLGFSFSGLGANPAPFSLDLSGVDWVANSGVMTVAVPVPEPGQWAMLLAGLGALALIGRRSKR